MNNIQNILENIEYIEPDTSLPIPDGMCAECQDPTAIELCEKCKEVTGQ